MSRTRLLSVIALVIIVSLIVPGCRRAPQLTSRWPQADRERTVPQPPAPLIFPYTGMEAPTRQAVEMRAVSIKIENSPAARPQTALNSADVVYETISEGGITRFNCIFQSKLPDRVGPVRSARLSDLWVVPQYGALFFFSGASTPVNRAIAKAGLPNLSEDAGVSAPYSRSSARSAPHNLYLSGKKVYPTARARGMKTTAKMVPLQFERRAKESSVTVKEVAVPFSDANTARWVYDSATGRYSRFNNGVKHLDEATGQQVTADNVVVLWVDYKPGVRTKWGSVTYDIVLGGKGRASVFHDGRRYDGTWTADRTTPPRFRDSQGQPVRLKRGRTWFQVIPLKGIITMK